MSKIHVGGASIPFTTAEGVVSRYIENKSGTSAYPAYDSYPGHPSPELGEADLLAITLLNAGQKLVPTYYSLRDLVPELNRRLSDERLQGDLATAPDATLDAVVELFGILDDRSIKNVRLTKLSKVLHRKRPQLIPLYDRQVRNCYFGLGSPRIVPVRGQSWRDMSRLWVAAVRDDLASQLEAWQELSSQASAPTITPLRALDIVAWNIGNGSAQYTTS